MESMATKHHDVAGLSPQLLRPPWKKGAWTPEEVSLALNGRRAALRQELSTLSAARGVDSSTLDKILCDAFSIVVMKRREIQDEDHLRRSFWGSVYLLLARHHEGRGSIRVGSRQRADFESVEQMTSAADPGVAEVVELKDRLARAADFMAQLDERER